jgi:hypothetical protein
VLVLQAASAVGRSARPAAVLGRSKVNVLVGSRWWLVRRLLRLLQEFTTNQINEQETNGGEADDHHRSGCQQ